MANAEQDFTRELEVFRTECEAAAQYFYGYLAIHELARRDKQVFQVLNRNAFFWNTVLSGLQTSALITRLDESSTRISAVTASTG